MQELDVPEYLTHVDKRLMEENERVLHYLDGGTRYHTNYSYNNIGFIMFLNMKNMICS